jgi:hypothetical protein
MISFDNAWGTVRQGEKKRKRKEKTCSTLQTSKSNSVRANVHLCRKKRKKRRTGGGVDLLGSLQLYIVN